MVERKLQRLPAVIVLLAAVSLAALPAIVPSSPPQSSSPGADRRGIAYRVVDLERDEILAESRPEVLARRTSPGSIVKIATLIAALESGVIAPDTRLECPGGTLVEGREVECVHPRFHRPITADEALGHSCNAYFATVARRLARGAFDRALVSLGLAPSDPSVALPVAALGLDGVSVAPLTLLDALARYVRTGGPSADGRSGATGEWTRAGHRQVVERGLRLAARGGTARALGEAGFDALAKTGTAPSPGGGYQGIVVAVTPAARPIRGVVVVVAGNAGSDAAAIAADLLKEHAPRERETDAVEIPRSLRVGSAGGDHDDVRVLEIEDYVARVVSAEAKPGTPAAALDALAIAARTYAAANLGRHRADGFDLCDLTHCQVMASSPMEPALGAAARTEGIVLVHEGKPAQVFYTASCGGISERASDAWPGARELPYIIRREDALCAREPSWTSEIEADLLARALVEAGFRGRRLERLAVVSRTPSGRVARLAVEGMTPAVVDGDRFRLAVGRTAGWQILKSTAFDVVRLSGGYRFTGRGSGHGVGMCMAAAARMADGGHTARSILSEFFPGAELVRASPALAAAETRTRIEILLPAGEEGAREALLALVRRSLQRFSDELSVPAPARLRLTFHPSQASYSRATGQPWWTSAATRGTGIHLLPLESLRNRGILETAIRHELVHVMTLPALAERPAWVYEGLAVHLAGEGQPTSSTPAGDGRQPDCPSDDELTRPISPEALGRAYQRAAACVRRALAAGTAWREIR